MSNFVFKVSRFVNKANAHFQKDKNNQNLNWNYYTCKSKRNIIDYITRKNACFKSSLNKEQMQELIQQNNFNVVKTFNNLMDSKENLNSGLFQIKSKDDFEIVSKTDAKKTFNKLNPKQYVWDSVISFDNEILKKHELYSQEEIIKFVAKQMDWILKKEKIPFENLNFFASIHANTQNPHVHLVFFEKEKKFINSKNGEVSYRGKGKFDFKNIQAFLNHLNSLPSSKEQEQVYKDKKDFWDIKNKIRNIYKESIRHNTLQTTFEFEQKFYEFSDELKKTNVKKLKDLSIEQKTKLSSMVNELISKDKKLSIEMKTLYQKLEDISKLQENENFKNKELISLQTNLENALLKEMIKTNQFNKIDNYQFLKNYNPNLNFISNNSSTLKFTKQKQYKKLPYLIWKIIQNYKKGLSFFSPTEDNAKYKGTTWKHKSL
ncbi:Uncharacterised protein [Mycoplasmopsis citelli]|uniref:Uncharacterized protein n=1 Tax=Mycoplasmopsis citelli TaxID=171281 RepID=A0A449B178_9BACT|nr:relaxase MobL [Mycoplasmopsis citelli]VEU74295.1 Uncharacterised protein [Mycoplasmopsis citelli]